MEEKIYTIPVNMAFEKQDGCPFCRLYRELEEKELDIIMGAAMMEPDIRIETNKLGFCKKHFNDMFFMKNRLSLAQMLESHLDTIKKNVEISRSVFVKDAGEKTAKFAREQSESCYVCKRIDGKLQKMVDVAALLWDRHMDFREKTEKQPYFCLEHYAMFINSASRMMNKKRYESFCEKISEIEMRYFNSLSSDVSWFCKKFDYRYENEDWGTSKDSVERSIKFLCGE